MEHVASSHGSFFVMNHSIGNGSYVWSNDSQGGLHHKVPGATCVTTDTLGGTCTDNPVGWHDADGAPYNCGWYSHGSNCADYGHGWKTNGKNAVEACCACGGGIKTVFDDNLNQVDDAATDKIISPSTSETKGITCGCNSCTPDTLTTVVEGQSLHDRIAFIVDNLNETEEEACELVCGEQFPEICGLACNPFKCTV